MCYLDSAGIISSIIALEGYKSLTLKVLIGFFFETNLCFVMSVIAESQAALVLAKFLSEGNEICGKNSHSFLVIF